jgi:hypothetical protein
MGMEVVNCSATRLGDLRHLRARELLPVEANSAGSVHDDRTP